jgi:hypothetical protein
MSYNSPFTGTVIQPTDVSYRSITLSADTQLEWPINGNATDDYAARIMQVTATSAGLELRMPPANQTSVGNDALIRNVGANSFEVKDYDGINVIATVAAGEAAYIYITTNPDEQGTWGLIDFGVGSSSVDAATLQGYGILAIGSTLNQSHPVNTFSSSGTADATYRAQTWVWTGGVGTLTLTQATTLGNNWFAMVRNSGTGLLTVATNGVDLIDGSLTLTVQPDDSCFIVCSGTAFYTVGLGRNTNFAFTQLTKNVTTGTYTLTAVEAGNVIQTYTGTLTGNVTIVVPPTVQVYYVSNQTVAGGFTVTITTNEPGGADYVIPDGQQSILICDSVNILNANSVVTAAGTLGIGNGTVSNPSLYFSSEVGTGVYRPSANQWGVSINGTQRLLVAASGITSNGGVSGTTGTFSGAVSGTTGTFSGAVSGTTGTFTSGVTGGTFS